MSDSHALLNDALLLLGGAVIAAPLAKRLGLGTVLGYLGAGLVIGPVLGRITEGESILSVAELGVVFLLFVIGLELKPQRLWQMRRDIFGLGAVQVILSGLVIAGLALWLGGLDWKAATVAGFGLALSSTAFAMQILEGKSDVNTAYGQRSFSILLFQDLAIVPLIALIAWLAPQSATPDGPSGWLGLAIALAAIVAMITAGRYLLSPLFHIIARTGAREAMIAAALFVVLASAALMAFAGLSMAMGAFMAGVMLAESSFRHELEADIEPFRGILLGLFFMAVGLSTDLTIVIENITVILISVLVLMAAKAASIYAVCRVSKSNHNDALRIALLLPQGGEFGFVLFTTAAASGVMDSMTASILIAIVTLSMALTPLASGAAKFFMQKDVEETMEEDFEGAGADVLMIGFSRFGQIASQILLSSGRNVTILDHSSERIRQASRFGFRIYYGDGTRLDVLKAAGIERAKIVCVCTHKAEITDRIVDLVRAEYPNAKLFVRSYDRVHALSLRAREVDYELRETLESGLLFGRKTLEELGLSEDEAEQIAQDVRKRDEARMVLQAAEGITAGRELIHTKPVVPEPLVEPRRRDRA